MSRRVWRAAVPVLALSCLVVAAHAGPLHRPAPRLADARHANLDHGRSLAAPGKADSLHVLGGPLGNGDFQDATGLPAWEGWTSVDLTEVAGLLWHVDTYRCANLDPLVVPNHAWWCGDIGFPSCLGGDPAGGYGNNWDGALVLEAVVPDPAQPTPVTVAAVLNHDCEVGFDYLHLEYETDLGWQEAGSWNGTADSVVVAVEIGYAAYGYAGDGGDEINLRWRFESDEAWSDEDCLNPTGGAAQLDNITVSFDGTPVSVEDNEDADPAANDWRAVPDVFVGDFARIWPELMGLDPCLDNPTPQVAFIDDGTPPSNAPGQSTGGYLCTTWCYGPGGYIVNPEGGLAGPSLGINNQIRSPVLAWPGAGYEGAELRFDVYRHQPLDPAAPAIFYVWSVRSTTDPDPAAIAEAAWRSRDLLYYGGPDYHRQTQDVTDLLESGRTWVQVSLGCYHLPWVWDDGTDGTPAPYFDNVALLAYPIGGPAISSREVDRPQDVFPDQGFLDHADLASNSCRFDPAWRGNYDPYGCCDHGDTIVFDVAAVRTGAFLAGMPRLYYKLDPNPLFDPYRSHPSEGWVHGDSTFTMMGTWIQNRYQFDLPDTGFFFPGDVIHYYVRAEDNAGGSVGVTILPADTTGFADFSRDIYYPTSFTVRALPTMFSDVPGDQPRVLFWNDAGNRHDDEDVWYWALRACGLEPGTTCDYFYTNAPSSGAGNGLGGYADADLIAGYDILVYTCGDQSSFTLSNGDFEEDSSDDLGLLDAWLRQGDKGLLLCGDDLVSDLAQAGPAGQLFLSGWMGVEHVAGDLRPLIGNQYSPAVRPVTGNPVFWAGEDWALQGGCPRTHTFDAVNHLAGAVRLAEFLDPVGIPGVFSYAAATLRHDATYGDRVVSLPYDLATVANPPGWQAPGGWARPVRALVLQEVLTYFGETPPPPWTGVPEAGRLRATHYPNPFNPATRIAYDMPAPGRLAIRVYNLRGGLVCTLLDRETPAGSGHVTWRGRDDAGAEVSSGVYFLEVAAHGQRLVRKAVLLR